MNDRPAEKLQRLLRDMFQFDCADLDFGIYRIMNFKRQAVERFIREDVIAAVGEELSRGILAGDASAAAELAELAGQIREALGEAALSGDGVLVEQFHETPLGKRYLAIQARATGALDRPALEAAICNHLYAFFSRYYDNGDFISKRRYSRREKYAIPYNGEEVYLHWANSDQYYVKTAEHFTDYRFVSHGVTVHFRLQQADVPQNNVKGDKRCFVPLPRSAAYDAEARQIVIPFEFRPLSDAEQTRYGQRNQQDAVLAEALESIPKALKKDDEALAALIAPHHRTADGQDVSVLAHHLRQYFRKNTADFFVHKDLKGFLSRELDFYLKNEVLNLEEMDAAGESRAEGWFQIMRVIRAIGGRIIEFLAQIEDFQKMLFEKRKFVTDTFYCITVGNIDEGFYPEIAGNDAQWAEWKTLFHIDEEQRSLFSGAAKTRRERRVAFLDAHPTLVLDTRHFDADFVDRLLAGFDDLDDMTDGLLVHSENFQALNLLLEKYRERVKCIYIDPPYNTKKDRFPYKDGYRISSWLAFMEDRLRLGWSLSRSDGVLWCSIDANQIYTLDLLLKRIYGAENRIGEVVWRNARDNNPTRIATEHEYILCYARDAASTEDAWKNEFADAKELLLNQYDELKRAGLSVAEIQRHIRRFIRDNKALLGEVDRYKYVDDNGIYTGSQSVHNPHPGGYEYDVLHPVTGRPMRLPATGYRFPEATMRREYIEKDRLIFGPDENRIVQIKLYLREYKDSLRSVIDLDGRLGPYALNALFGGGSNVYENPKPPQLLDRLLSFSGMPETLVLDFFAGSGTTAQAVVEVARQTRVAMRFILVEMDDSLEGIVLPRLKKVTYSPEWRDGKPARQATAEEAERSPRIVKVIRLESYEDALNNIEFDEEAGQAALKFDDYLLSYMLKWETKGSATLLNVEQLARPFHYRLRIEVGGEIHETVVDLPETFAYLLGLHVKNRRVLHHGDRRYVVYRGRIDHREVVVIWRDAAGWQKADYEQDKKFVAREKLAEGADEVFVNSDSVIPGARSLDGVFKARMFAPVGV